MAFSEVSAAIRTAASLKKFVEGDGLRLCLANLSLGAAYEALSRADLARDKSAQVRSALTHLEIADVALRPTHSMFRPANEERKRRRRCKVIALEILCALYLDEKEVARKLWKDLDQNHRFNPYELQMAGKGVNTNGELFTHAFSFLASLPSRMFSDDWDIGFDVGNFLETSASQVGET